MANILGIKLEESAPAATWEKILGFLREGGRHYVVTPNPEIILASHADEELFFILNKADLALADGFGLKVAAGIFGIKLYRQTGADLSARLLTEAARRRLKVLVLNRRDGLSSAAEIEASARSQYPGLEIKAIDAAREGALSAGVSEEINSFAPAILFNTFGCPYQEKSIYHNLEKWPSVRLALAVGGSFDYLTGKARRAPQAWRSIGLEWLWRLFRQPKRYRRIWRATVVFLAKVLKSRFINPHLYRPNVACLLYKDEGGVKQAFIVEREEEPGHWQLPQGGRDGESVAVAGARELREEAGTANFITRGSFPNVSRYEFGPVSQHDSEHPEGKKYKFDYKGQRQSLYIAEFRGADSEIKINFWDHSAWKWVPIERLAETVHPHRRENTLKFLEKFNSLKL